MIVLWTLTLIGTNFRYQTNGTKLESNRKILEDWHKNMKLSQQDLTQISPVEPVEI